MFQYTTILSVTVLFALIFSCIKPLDDLIQSSKADIDIVSEDGTRKDTIACHVNENIVIGISVLPTDLIDSIAFKATDSISEGFSKNEIVNLIKINLTFDRPDTAVIIATGYKNGASVASDSAMLIITAKEDLNKPPVVQLKPIRNYASPALPCSVKVSVTSPEVGQDLELTLIPRGGDIVGESLFVWIPKASDIGNSVPIVLIARDNGFPPRATSGSVIITVIADNKVLSKPQNLRVVQRTDNFARITWKGDSLADSYILYRKNSKKDSEWEEVVLSDTSFIDSSDAVSFYRVAAVNFFGVSKPSETIQGTDTIHYARRVFFTDTGSTAYESDSIHRVKIKMTAPSANDITVWYTVKSADISKSSTLIQAGDTTGVCSLIIVNDTVFQGRYTMSLNLDSVSSGFIYGNDTHAISIVDDDTMFTVVYDGNGATGGRIPEDGNRYARGDSVKILMNNGNLIKSGYSFYGWHTNRDSGTTVYTPGMKFIMGSQSVTLYAKWKINTYTVTYDGNGNTSGTIPSPQTKIHGAALTLAYNTGGLSKASYIFMRWNTAADRSGTDYAVGSSYTDDKAVTLYAQYEKWVPTPRYKIIYHGNGNTGGTIPSQQIKTHGVAVTLASNTGNLVRGGYTFTGWNTDSDGSGMDYAVGASYLVDSDVILYAKWKINTYTITYDGNGNTSGLVPSQQTKTHGVSLTLASNTGNLVRTGYTFTGWNTAADGRGTYYEVGASYTVDAGATLYAKWTPAYTINYNGNGNTGGRVPSSQIKVHGVSLTLASNTGNLVRTGYTFTGWNTASNGKGTDYAEGARYTANIGMTLYAKWKKKTYTIRYNGNGNTGGKVPSSQTKVYGVSLTLASNTGNLVRTGYTFTGWNTTSNGDGKDYAEGARYTANTGMTLYAKWEKKTYTIRYNGNGNTGGKVPSSQTKVYGVPLTLASNTGNLVRTGYTFTGWNTASNGNGKDYAEGARYTANAGMTLYAKWKLMWIDNGSTLTDPDGNVYTTVTIGTQVWTVENLKTTRYNDGEAIPLVTGSTEWKSLETPGYCWYENDEAVSKATYGALYNWYAVNTGKLAPSGWRIPTDEDWNTLQNYLITNGYNYDSTTTDNKIAKAMAAQSDWRSSTKTGAIGNDLTKNNTCGFSAFPGGYREGRGGGNFRSQSSNGCWWSATERDTSDAWLRILYYDDADLYRDSDLKKSGNSIRFVRD